MLWQSVVMALVGAVVKTVDLYTERRPEFSLPVFAAFTTALLIPAILFPPLHPFLLSTVLAQAIARKLDHPILQWGVFPTITLTLSSHPLIPIMTLAAFIDELEVLPQRVILPLTLLLLSPIQPQWFIACVAFDLGYVFISLKERG
jgi:hypothetical protein